MCAFLDSRLLCSLASWLVLGSSFPVLVICSFLLSGVLSLASGSCLCAPLVCILLLSTDGLPLVSVSWDVFPRPSVCYGFSLLFFWPSYQSVSALFRSGAVSGLLVLSAAGVPGSLFPLRCFAFRHVVSVPICSKVYSELDGFVLRPLRWCSAVSSCSSAFSGLADPFYFSSPSLSFWSVLGGRCSPSFPPFSPLVTSRLALSFCHRAPGLLFAAGSVFLPSLPSWSVGSLGSPRLGVPLCSGGGSSQGCPCSVSSVCIGSAPFLPSSPDPPVYSDLVVVLSPR